jgi:hypothetical protein
MNLPDERFCVECGYNLAGLDEPRCPECGASSTPDALAEMKQAGKARFGRLMLFPLAATLLGLGCGMILEMPGMEHIAPVLLLVGTLIFLLLLLIQSVKTARRLAISRAVTTHGKRPLREASAFVIGMSIALFCCNAMLCGAGFFGGCVCGFFAGPNPPSFH